MLMLFLLLLLSSLQLLLLISSFTIYKLPVHDGLQYGSKRRDSNACGDQDCVFGVKDGA